MNIFRILSSNDGSINEPNVSSFLAYLLNPNEDHGISSLLLHEVINDIININPDFLKKIRFANRSTDLSIYSGYLVNVSPEVTVSLNVNGKKKRRDIDILLEIIDNKSNEILYAICLENKITDLSISKNDSQLEDELKGLKNYYAESDLYPEIYVIYLTPYPSEISRCSFEKLDYNKKHHLFWDNHENSIFNKLNKIFNAENNGLIDPINNQTSYLIKSFMSFIKTNFKSYIEEREEKLEKKNYGKPVIDFLNDFASTLEPDEVYEIDTIKIGFSKYVLSKTGMELHNNTRNIHISLSIVNEKNRWHYNVKKADDNRRNIFQYTDDTKKKIKLFDSTKEKNIKIYYKSNDEIEYIISGELIK